MSQMMLSERVNGVATIINNMTIDPSERLGIAASLYEIYKFELSKVLTINVKKGGENEANKTADAAAPAETETAKNQA